MPLKNRICVVTSTRAEYGLLHWLLKGVEKSSRLELILAVTGSHLSVKHGSTYKFIEADGHIIAKKIGILKGKAVTGVGNTAGLAVSKFTEYFSESKPSAVVLLGDRYEILSIAQAAVISAIPVIHLHGGEVTEGANDNLFRNAITKLSSFHFTSNAEHRERVIQMGEHPSTVKVSGALGIENIKKFKLLNRAELEKKYTTKFKRYIFLITFHPATLEKEAPEDQFKNLLRAICRFEDTTYVISRSNVDAGGDEINKVIDEFCKGNKNAIVSHSFGQLNYLSFLKAADVVIGNSSSGIIEAPSLYTSTVNVGTRQKGRMSAASVINCGTGEKEIIGAIKKALAAKNRKLYRNPYDHGAASEKIVDVLEGLNFAKLLPKKFYDIK